MTRGVTLVELLAALAVLGAGLGVATVALASLAPPPAAAPLARLAAARARAVREGAPQVVREGALAVRFEADGSASCTPTGADSGGIVVDPLTGSARAAR